jgi:transcriptional regulator with PAS, ATPase and Fis domain
MEVRKTRSTERNGHPTRASDAEIRLAELQRELEETKRLDAAIFDASADGIAVFSPDGLCLKCNAAWKKATGLEGVGKTDGELYRALGYKGPRLWDEISAARLPAAILVKFKSNTFLVAARGSYDSSGTLTHVIVTQRNLTDLDYLREHLERHRPGEYRNLTAIQDAHLTSKLQAASMGNVIVESPGFRKVLLLAAQAASVETSIILYGETGTGKGLVATLIHRLSERKGRPFVELNCGAIPEGLVESELFGYEPGAFTDSRRSGKKGQIELADRGTIFLDEIADLPLSAQVKLLKFLDNNTILPIGASSPRGVDVRIIAATNADLRERVRRGQFREDLLYRLEVLPIAVPPLRERTEDIEPLVHYFLAQFNRDFRENRYFDEAALSHLLAYEFPGNVRELRNLIARLVITAKGQKISVDDLPLSINSVKLRNDSSPSQTTGERSSTAPGRLKISLQETERRVLESHARAGHSLMEIARELGIHSTSVSRKLKKYKISLQSDHSS